MTLEAVYALALASGLTRESAIIATAIACGENEKLDPTVEGDVNLQDKTWGPSIGLWQIRSLRDQLGTGRERDASRLKEPAFNAAAMFVISGGGRTWTPWTIYKTGAYLRHLDAVRAATKGVSTMPDLPIDDDPPAELDAFATSHGEDDPIEVVGSDRRRVIPEARGDWWGV